jgi:hypothetical protein
MLQPFDIVTISEDFEDPEVRGKRAFIMGEVTPDQCGVFVYDLERVWCLEPRFVTATGTREDPANYWTSPSIRVSTHGEVLD